MYFDSLTALLYMDGHGIFVWSAYAISTMVIAVCIAQPLLRYRVELKRLATARRAAAQQSAQSSQAARSAGLGEHH